MIKKAINELNQQKGSSIKAICDYIYSNMKDKLDKTAIQVNVSKSLKRMKTLTKVRQSYNITNRKSFKSSKAAASKKQQAKKSS